jgi:hypothetical protein
MSASPDRRPPNAWQFIYESPRWLREIVERNSEWGADEDREKPVQHRESETER